MKKKKAKTLFFLCAFLAVLVGAYAAVMVYNKNRDEQVSTSGSTEEEKVILSLEGTVTEMTVESEGGTLEFVLKDEEWSEKNHEGFAMRQPVLTSMAAVFEKLVATHTIEENTENLSEYGLDKPSYILTAKTQDGKEAQFCVGMQNTVTMDYYVYTKDVPGVYTIGTSSVNYFKRDLMEFADLPSYPKVSEGNFLSLETRDGEEHLKAETLTESAYDMSGILSWYVTEPFEHEYVAHTTMLDTVLSAVAELTYSKAAAYNPDEAELARMGLDKPQKELAFTYKKDSTSEEEKEQTFSFRLLIGNVMEGSNYYYVMEEGSKLVLLMSKESLDTVLSYKAKDIVNKYFALINIETVDSVRILLEDGSELELVTPENDADDAKADALRDVYQSIISIHAERVIDSQTGPFTMLPLTLTFYRNTEPKLYQIQFAEYDTSYYLAIVDGEGIYLVNRRDYDQYCKDVKAGFEGLSE